MLDFCNLNFVDSHLHLADCKKFENLKEIFSSDCKNFSKYSCLSCSQTENEFLEQKKLKSELEKNQNLKINLAFALHPQNPSLKYLDFLENLLKTKQISVLGEMGFDFWGDYKNFQKEQQILWNTQLELAEFYKIPVVLHFRKELENIFSSAARLKNLPGVMFHSFFWAENEAFSILKKIPTSYFSFGKQLLNENKKSISCVKSLPLENLLLETDAPFQVLKNENFTSVLQIFEIYKKAYHFRNPEDEDFKDFEIFCKSLETNFYNFYKA